MMPVAGFPLLVGNCHYLNAALNLSVDQVEWKAPENLPSSVEFELRPELRFCYCG
jgi:hypothetical protein